ncbi:NUDIX hydrolase [Sulfolobus sp. A20]|uniref:NUDIX hydrolase n=1 Tax=Sulfolobaceae TaxID=118883 RepID=UPI000845FBBF|nr:MULTISPECIES: NUDIX hydrolase [unclassified Sulfolobus]TRM77517.1 NUDIX hydrolase [Sulfolobus sp. A20-N-F8]TRM79331.1 NUDIX hydrolase [Sulfolobus sp. B5]TRM85950.1 NUDIX hydrolase [Sulfolobus sp. E3]TRM89419.1 NUDIX hydrolase [Sulfolobus sp. C3]TRM97544.1 NUDIX hydrolase [Sulfolobus sp. F1]TRM99811.1 NUDIX hydrolase [Sulfolobus sp. E1]
MKIFSGKKFEVHVEKTKLPNGYERELEYIKHRGSVVIIPRLDDEKVVLIKQYRPVIGKWIYELPAGTLEENENPIEAAERELIEEVGYKAEKLTEIVGFYSSPGISSEYMRLYLAENLKYVGARPEPYEIIEPIEVKIEDAINMIKEKKIEDAKTIIGLLILKTHLNL